MNSVNAIYALKNLQRKNPDFSFGKFPKTCVVGEKTSKALRDSFQIEASVVEKNLAELMPKLKEFYEREYERPKILYLVGSLSDLATHIKVELTNKTFIIVLH